MKIPMNVYRIVCVAALLLVLAQADAALAESGTTFHVPADYPTIQGAINAASDGDEIIVAPGTYNEAVDFLGKAIVLRSSDGPEATTIDATGLSTSVVRCISGEGATSILNGFTITGGTGTGGGPNNAGGGMLNDNQSSPTVVNCYFINNTASSGGGMANLANSNPSIVNCVFTNNTSHWGGGMTNRESSPHIENSVFEYNFATSRGGAIYNWLNSNPTISQSMFENNATDGYGGALHNRQGSSPSVTDCLMKSNAAENGGGMYNHSSTTVVIVHSCVFESNSAVVSGGGMYNEGSNSVAISQCTFVDNTAHIGGGLRIRAESISTVTDSIFQTNTANFSGGGLSVSQNSNHSHIDNCTFKDNSANNIGGAIHVSSVTSPTISGCVIVGNSALSGGGMWAENGSSPTVVNTHFEFNSANKHGGAAYFSTNAMPTFYDCVFVSNVAQLTGGAVYNVSSTTSTFVGCVFEFNAATQGGAIGSVGTGSAAVGESFFCSSDPDHVAGDWSDLGGNEFLEFCHIQAHLDIRPGSCPNPLNPNSQGVLPVALLGTDEFDVSAVNLETLTLSRADGIGGSATPNFGPPGPSPKIEDVGTPFDGDDCDCHDLGGDGIPDLSLKFWMAPLVGALELDAEYSDTYIELVLTGEMNDGTPFIANDCARIVGQPHNPSGQPSLIPATGIPSLDQFLNESHRSTSHQD